MPRGASGEHRAGAATLSISGTATKVLVNRRSHGNVDNFRRILDLAQLARIRRHLVLQELLHGPHRYRPAAIESHQLLDLFAALKCQHPAQVHYLVGNHELSQWTGRAIAKGETDFNAVFREGIGTAYGPRAAEIYQAYFDLFALSPWRCAPPTESG